MPNLVLGDKLKDSPHTKGVAKAVKSYSESKATYESLKTATNPDQKLIQEAMNDTANKMNLMLKQIDETTKKLAEGEEKDLLKAMKGFSTEVEKEKNAFQTSMDDLKNSVAGNTNATKKSPEQNTAKTTSKAPAATPADPSAHQVAPQTAAAQQVQQVDQAANQAANVVNKTKSSLGFKSPGEMFTGMMSGIMGGTKKLDNIQAPAGGIKGIIEKISSFSLFKGGFDFMDKQIDATVKTPRGSGISKTIDGIWNSIWK